MRITQRAIALTSLQGLERNLTTLSKMQERLTSGKQISKASESPTGANISMQTRTESITAPDGQSFDAHLVLPESGRGPGI